MPAEFTRQAQLDAIRAKCVEANPEIKDARCIGCKSPDGMDGLFVCWFCGRNMCRPIRLADVLHAATAFPNFVAVDVDGYFYKEVGSNWHIVRPLVKWSLLRDSLDDQSDECIAFLYSFLCTKP